MCFLYRKKPQCIFYIFCRVAFLLLSKLLTFPHHKKSQKLFVSVLINQSNTFPVGHFLRTKSRSVSPLLVTRNSTFTTLISCGTQTSLNLHHQITNPKAHQLLLHCFCLLSWCFFNFFFFIIRSNH